jgi:hypothetical protein
MHSIQQAAVTSAVSVCNAPLQKKNFQKLPALLLTLVRFAHETSSPFREEVLPKNLEVWIICRADQDAISIKKSEQVVDYYYRWN